MPSQAITFYDIPSKPGGAQTRSFNTLKTRFALGYKGLTFETVWVGYADIEKVCKEVGASPTGIRRNGEPHYTLPVIHDHSTGRVVSDGYVIAKYLDEQYPDTPKLLHPGTEALQTTFVHAHMGAVSPIFPLILGLIGPTFEPRHADAFRRAREIEFGRKLEEVIPADAAARKAQWALAKDGYDTVDAWLQKSGGPFAMGDTISFVDGTIASFLFTFKHLFGEESTEWQDIKKWNDGRWGKFLSDLEKYFKE
ncbi:hypothetical protein HGRIS_006244 [Hohenbuehelia grisea]|uniref:GST N-terminal domain-containing protein n=1 Tax=Hohenbuehelia grisea TaxID=104357 RepID=A0ABR3K0A1_9AGAR